MISVMMQLYLEIGRALPEQPRDRSTRGVLHLLRVYRESVMPTLRMGKGELLQVLLAAWDSTSHHATLRGWDCFVSIE